MKITIEIPDDIFPEWAKWITYDASNELWVWEQCPWLHFGEWMPNQDEAEDAQEFQRVRVTFAGKVTRDA